MEFMSLFRVLFNAFVFNYLFGKREIEEVEGIEEEYDQRGGFSSDFRFLSLISNTEVIKCRFFSSFNIVFQIKKLAILPCGFEIIEQNPTFQNISSCLLFSFFLLLIIREINCYFTPFSTDCIIQNYM